MHANERERERRREIRREAWRLQSMVPITSFSMNTRDYTSSEKARGMTNIDVVSSRTASSFAQRFPDRGGYDTVPFSPGVALGK